MVDKMYKHASHSVNRRRYAQEAMTQAEHIAERMFPDRAKADEPAATRLAKEKARITIKKFSWEEQQ